MNPSHSKEVVVRFNLSHFQAQSNNSLRSDWFMRLEQGVRNLHSMNCQHFHIIENQLRCYNFGLEMDLMKSVKEQSTWRNNISETARKSEVYEK